MEQSKFLGLMGVAILFMIFAFTIPTEGCMCQRTHPQTAYCQSDYVIIARILRKAAKSKPGYITYKIDIKKTYKMSEKAKYYLKEGRIMTPASEAMCGRKFEIGKIYVIAGRGPNVNLCSYVSAYKDMTIIERRGFAGFYRKGCKCEITPCYSHVPGACEESNDICQWRPFGTCQTQYSACLPGGRVSKCHWRQTPAYKTCIRQP